VSTSPSGYVTAFGEAGVPTFGLEGGVGCNPRVTFDGKVRNLGPCVLKFDSPYLRTTETTSLRQPTVPATTVNSAGLRLDLRQQCLPRVEAG